ncbi:dihydropteridine reductase [Lacicoccus alkaliphilus]|uniref:Ferredoxin--NADP+ reductase n=1 Tax=Lacicoccus alkaliphilus DSM 16010 TaxID=1123231 RepID=A0A1M7E2S2_9BACL|nr:dihydropteridine reductase [Salinicoccus alkaliphilus]SHL86003.1 ferredoxin--NADP+ reductase [Salinicoccus alkaliphilus DSM 16010]
MKIYWTKIADVIEETPETKTYVLECPEDFTWEEGAHTHLALEGFNAGERPDRTLIRHMSICTLPGENMIGITTRIRKECSEFKQRLDDLPVGGSVALFKTHSNVPLRREGRPVYLLSSGVGLATFRPLVLDFFNNPGKVDKVHSVNIDSSKDYLYPDFFVQDENKRFFSEFYDNRTGYYDRVKTLAEDKDGLYYIVGSDEFLSQNIKLLCDAGIRSEQIMLDKHEDRKRAMIEYC